MLSKSKVATGREYRTKQRASKFKHVRNEVIWFCKQNIQDLYVCLRFFERLPVNEQKEIYEKYSFGNVFHYKIFFIFFSELQSIVENEKTFNSFDMIIAVKDLMEKYKYKLAFIHSKYLLFHKVNKNGGSNGSKFYKIIQEILVLTDDFRFEEKDESFIYCLTCHCCYFLRVSGLMRECIYCLKSNRIYSIEVYDQLINSFENIVSDFCAICKENAVEVEKE